MTKAGGSFCQALAVAGYDDVLSIEHEDQALPPLDGVRQKLPTYALKLSRNPSTVAPHNDLTQIRDSHLIVAFARAS